MAAGLALVASLCYGISNFIGPVLSRDLPVYALLIAGQVVAFCVSAAVVGVTPGPAHEAQVWGAALAAGVGNAVGLIAFYRAAGLGPLSIVAPIGSLGAVVPVLAGIAGGEPLGAAKLVGLVLALGGVALASRRRGGVPVEGHHTGKAAAWALASAAGFGVFLTLMAPASTGGVFWAVAVSRVAVLTTMFAAAWSLGAALSIPLRALPRVAVPGLLLFVGTLTYSAATRAGDLSVVSVLGSLFPVVTVLLAFTLQGERLSRVQGAGVASALAGVVLVSMRYG